MQVVIHNGTGKDMKLKNSIILGILQEVTESREQYMCKGGHECVSQTSVLRPLYPEVKQYIENLLNQNFIEDSKYRTLRGLFASKRKKDGILRLRINYREQNRRTVAERHLIPIAQETLEFWGDKTPGSVPLIREKHTTGVCKGTK